MSPQDWLSAAEAETRGLTFRLHAVKAGRSAFGQAVWLLTIVVPHQLFGYVVYGVSLPHEALAHEHATPWEHWYRLRTLPTLTYNMQMAELVPLSAEVAQREQERLESVPPAPHLYPNRYYIVSLTSPVGVGRILRAQRGCEAWQHLVAVNGVAIEDLTQPEAAATVGTETTYHFKIRDGGLGFAETSAQGLLMLAELEEP